MRTRLYSGVEGRTGNRSPYADLVVVYGGREKLTPRLAGAATQDPRATPDLRGSGKRVGTRDPN
jgi:hypothetical protein